MSTIQKVVKHISRIPFPPVKLSTSKEDKAIVIPVHLMDSVLLWMGVPAGVLMTLLTIA